MSEARWERLAADLAAAGVEAKLTARSYSETVYGRVRHGVTYRLTIRREDGALVEVHDKYWRKNPDTWLGWEVHLEGRDSIVRGTWPLTKKRSEVVVAVRAALELTVVVA